MIARTPLFIIAFCFIGRLPLPRLQENHPPSVKVLSPANRAVFPAGGILSFTIAVSDQEDGDSQFDEIDPRQVVVTLTFGKNKAHADRLIRQPVPSDPEGLRVILRSNCMNCHNFREKSIGPSLAVIARTYSSRRIPADTALRRIKNGSAGFWPGREKMPSHPEISDQEVKQAVHWLLKNAGNDTIYYAGGLSGSLRLPARRGWYVLTASYTDHGPKAGSGKGLKGSSQIEVLVQ